MGLVDIDPEHLLPILVAAIIVGGLAIIEFILFLIPSAPEPVPSEYTYRSASSPEEHIPLPSLGDPARCALSVVVPAYNETPRLVPMLDEALEHLHSLKPRRSFEIILVDDGSSDGTSELALKYARSHSKDEIRVVRLETNRMKGGAVKHGVMHSCGERILFVDADGATKFSDLELLWKGMDALEKEKDSTVGVVVGSRAHMVQSEAVVKRSVIRNFLMYGFHFTLRVLGVGWIQDTQCGFKLFTRPAAQALFPPLHLANWIFDVELLLLASHLRIPVKEVPVHWHEVAGSKLNVATATVGMVYDLLVMRMSYAVGRWSAWDGYVSPGGQMNGTGSEVRGQKIGKRED